MTISPYTSQEAAIKRANAAQNQASDPCASVFVSASAGSGKTKLLIDRLLRLMLPSEVERDGKKVIIEGSHPGRIVCLTYTKAAAAEMASRLQDRLGKWVSLPDNALGAELEALNVPCTSETLKAARGLFIKVLDLPGGLRIETIHAFCQSLLRRFPLEASLDPHFALSEGEESKLMQRQAFESELSASPQSAALLGGECSFDAMLGVLGDLFTKSGLLTELEQKLALRSQDYEALYGDLLGWDGTTQEALEKQDRVSPIEAELLQQLELAAPGMSVPGRELARPLEEWLRQKPQDRKSFCLDSVFLTSKDGAKKIKAMNRIAGKEAQKLAPELIALLEQEGERRLEIYHKRKILSLVRIEQAFLSLALPVYQRFEQAKRQRGSVDYADLIDRTRALLRNPGAAWVLYKLDGGIDHLLLDEVQDTAGSQWEIAGALTEDFFSGETAGSGEMVRPRTIFAVGDFKQSIYSFQGAEPRQFHEWRQKFAQRVKQAGLEWREPVLDVSFRSVPPILSFVDQIFADEQAAQSLAGDGRQEHISHVSSRAGQGGRVELWPLARIEPESGEDNPWETLRHNKSQKSAMYSLVETLARWIRTQIGKSPQPGQKPLKAGDILILVSRRSAFVTALIRALKKNSIPVANFLRAKVTDQPVVRDLMTLCAALLLPQDNLSLASVLTSPWGGVSDSSLMALIIKEDTSLLRAKEGFLWDVLKKRHQERPEWRAVWENLLALYRRVDFDSPYEILMQALGPLGGRARIFARLGPEASDGIDELLTMALDYEKEHAPSLQGFLRWMEESDLETRCESETASDEVRIMTVHGAKGLQARLVILPDTMSFVKKKQTGGSAGDLFWTGDQQQEKVPVWVPRTEMAVTRTNELKQEKLERAIAEDRRLLYVALTRASDWLVICGWKEPPKNRDKEDQEESVPNWYQLCEQAFGRLEGVSVEDSGLEWGGETRVLQELPEREEKIEVLNKVASTPILPAWMGTAPDWQAEVPPREAALARPLTPSKPEGIEFGPAPAARSPLEILRQMGKATVQDSGRAKALRRGQLVHRLLQRLPEVPPEARHELAFSWLSRPAWQLGKAEITALLKSVFAILDNEALGPLFSTHSRAEQSISGTIQLPSSEEGLLDGRVVLGKIDRFCLEKETLWLCDYKTNRFPPRVIEQTPVVYLRQMAAYRAVMKQLYPDHRIRCFLLWTEGPQIDEVPVPLLEKHLWG